MKFQENNAYAYVVCEMVAFCLSLNVLSYETAEVSSYLKVSCWDSDLGRLPGLWHHSLPA